MEDINFHPMAWYNYFDQKGEDGNPQYTISANYFMNMNSQGLSFTLNELRVARCTFTGHVRGFIRFQGPNRQLIEKLTVDDCVFYDEEATTPTAVVTLGLPDQATMPSQTSTRT